MTTTETDGPEAVDQALAALDDWRGDRLAALRRVILDAHPDVVETVRWRKPTNPLGVPTWSCDGIVCTGESYAAKIKLTFAQGAALEDPTGLFNASLTAGTRRAIDVGEDDVLDHAALADLVRAAVAHNRR